MSSHPASEDRGLYKFGGAAFVVSGGLFFANALLDLSTGAPPATGDAILAWVASHKLALSFISEVLFFATMFLVPAVIALSSVPVSRATPCP